MKRIEIDNRKVNISKEDRIIAVEGENFAEKIVFVIARNQNGVDLSGTVCTLYWINDLGSDTKELPLEVKGGNIEVEWDITTYETGASGALNFELMFTKDELIYKTISNYFVIVKSLEEDITQAPEYPTLLADLRGNAEFAQEQGDYAKEQGDYAKAQGDYAAMVGGGTSVTVGGQHQQTWNADSKADASDLSDIVNGTTEVPKATTAKNYDPTSGTIKTKIGELSDRIYAREGIGGYLTAYDFGTATPTQQALTDYALSQIPNITEPVQIFNSTRVKNLYDEHLWILTNTPDTDPAVFEWTNNGYDTIKPAENYMQGTVKGSDYYGDGYDGDVFITNGRITVHKEAIRKGLEAGSTPCVPLCTNSVYGYDIYAQFDELATMGGNTPPSIPLRTSDNTIRTKDPIHGEDAANKQWSEDLIGWEVETYTGSSYYSDIYANYDETLIVNLTIKSSYSDFEDFKSIVLPGETSSPSETKSLTIYNKQAPVNYFTGRVAYINDYTAQWVELDTINHIWGLFSTYTPGLLDVPLTSETPKWFKVMLYRDYNSIIIDGSTGDSMELKVEVYRTKIKTQVTE